MKKIFIFILIKLNINQDICFIINNGGYDKNDKIELIEIDEIGKPLEKKGTKKPTETSETSTHVLAIFFAYPLLGLFLKIFVFHQNIDQTNLYHKYKTAEDMKRNVGETIIDI